MGAGRHSNHGIRCAVFDKEDGSGIFVEDMLQETEICLTVEPYFPHISSSNSAILSQFTRRLFPPKQWVDQQRQKSTDLEHEVRESSTRVPCVGLWRAMAVKTSI